MTERTQKPSGVGIETSEMPHEAAEMQVLEALAEMVGHDLGIPEDVLSGEVIPELPTTDPNTSTALSPQKTLGPLRPDSAA